MNARTPELQAAAGIVLQRARGETSAPASAAGRARWWVPVARIAVLQITDFAALCVAAALAYLVWAGAILHQPAGVYLSITPTLLCLPLGYAAVGLYPGFGIGAVEALRRYTLCTTFAFLALASATFFLKLPHEFSRATFFFAWLGALIIVPAARLGVVLIFSRRAWWRKEVVLVGTKSWVERTLRELTQAPAIGYRPTAILLTESKRRLDISLPGVRELSDPLGLMHEARAGSCDVLVEDGGRLNLLYSRVLRHFQRVVIFANYRNLPIEGARPCLLGGMLGVQITNNLLLRRNRVVKRILDVVLSSAMLIAAVPLIGLSALLIPLFDWGVPFYSQERRGLGGRSIRVWKLRTMHRDAEERLKTHLAADPAAHAEW
ncbi:MAG: sugar transferase, partial [Candidatus Binataceae bacterium]